MSTAYFNGLTDVARWSCTGSIVCLFFFSKPSDFFTK